MGNCGARRPECRAAWKAGGSRRPARAPGRTLVVVTRRPSAPLGRHEGADDPEERDEDADDEHHPVALADRDDPEGHEQHEVDRAQQYDSGG